jgi:spore germination cell wall hydrolase CwlJ-like protein
MTSDNYSGVLTALCLWREARGQSADAKRGVLHVILNRIATKFRGNDLVSVIQWPSQFSSFNHGNPDADLLPNPKNPLDWKSWLECCAVVDAPGDDPTSGAVMYESEPEGSRPAWATADNLTATIGPFRFYKK